MEKKYEFTEESKVVNGITLHRIQAIKNFGTVKAGDLGGWIEKEENLSQDGDCWVFEGAQVFGNARIFLNALIRENTRIFGNAQVYENTRIFGDAQVYENARIFGNALVCGNCRVYGDAQVYENARIFGNALVCGNVRIYGNAEIYQNAEIYKDADIHGDSQVCGDAQLYGNIDVYGDAFIHGNSLIIGHAVLGDHAYIQHTEHYIIIGPTGSRDDFTTFYKTKNEGIWVCCGCFNEDIDTFEKRVKMVHEETIYEKQYLYGIEYAKKLLNDSI